MTPEIGDIHTCIQTVIAPSPKKKIPIISPTTQNCSVALHLSFNGTVLVKKGDGTA
jgi:hypothetical protein